MSDLPMIAELIDGLLSDNRQQYAAFLQAKQECSVLDDDTVVRMERVYTERADFLELFDEQLAHWREQALSNMQKLEIARLAQALNELKITNGQILHLAAELK
jgi:hypothetical protein